MTRRMTLTACLRRLARAVWPAAVLLFSPRALPAQIPDWLARDHRVLLHTASGSIVIGVVTGRHGDSITVATRTGETRLARADIGQLEVSRAIRSRTARGGALGIALGVTAGVAIGVAQPRDRAAGAVMSAIFFAALAAPLGGFVGSQFHSDVWTKVYPAPRARFSLAPSRVGIRAAVTLAVFGGSHP